MKRILLITGLAAFISCNDSSKTAETDTDSTNVTAHETTSDNTAHSMDTTTMSGMSMMTIMQKNMDQMKAMPSTGSPDNDFASMMKTHHMGAVEMVQLELAKGTNTEMKQMAQLEVGTPFTLILPMGLPVLLKIHTPSGPVAYRFPWLSILNPSGSPIPFSALAS